MEISHGLAQWDFNSPKAASATVAHPRSFITDHWFLEESKNTTTALQITRLLYIINYFYSIRKYDQCLIHIQQGLDLNYSKKKEFLEIKARVLKRLHRLQEALDICNLFQKLDPSLLFLKGQLLLALGHYAESMDCFVEYLEKRPDDYSAWMEMSRIATQISKKSHNFHGISSADWSIIADIMKWISDILFNRPTLSRGELFEISKSKRISQNISFNDLTGKEVESTISLLFEFKTLSKAMRLSCLQLGIIEVG